MKLMICGKGGCGKSTLSVLLARAFSGMGRPVLLVDADESNFGIPHLLGIAPPMHLLDHFGGKKGFKEKLNRKFPVEGEGIFVNKQTTGELPPACVGSVDGIRVVSIGKIHHFGEGCACPMGVLARRFLGSLIPAENEIIIVDSEAGVEHFGRGVIGEIDSILVIVDPTAESFLLAGKMLEMGEKAGKAVHFVLNKVEPAVEAIMVGHLDPDRVIGKIPVDNGLFMASLEGKPLNTVPAAIAEIGKQLAGRRG